jgi:hypothetical protein
VVGVTLNIYEFSTPANKQILVQAYQQGQNEGLVNALEKMKAVGHLEITGAPGSDWSFIRVSPAPLVARLFLSRIVRFAWQRHGLTDIPCPSTLTAGILELNDHDKCKIIGVLYPADQIVLDKEGESQWELLQNPWRLSALLDWKGTAGLN